MNTNPQVTSLRAIEALRSGVPNRDAVHALGSSQPFAEQRFKRMLTTVPEATSRGVGAPGLLFAGDFGTGKSHLLEYLQHVALGQNFICSKIVISKETPLYDLDKVYRAALQSARMADWMGGVLRAIARDLKFDGPEYREFYQWLTSKESGLDPRFAATALIFEQGRGGRYPEISDQILRFWGGSRFPEKETRSWLQELGEEATFKFNKISDDEVVRQRYRFISRLITTAGYAGWVILVDEVELIGRYSAMQRAVSYAVMARLVGASAADSIPGLATVLAITSAYQSEVMDYKQDQEKLPERLRSSEDTEDRALAGLAELGMQKIRQIPEDNLVLTEAINLAQIYNKCRNVYFQAYGWTPPIEFQANATWRIRQHIKRWINSWDFSCLFQGAHAELEVVHLEPTFSEDRDREKLAHAEPEEVQKSRSALPSFMVVGGSETYKGRVFTPDRKITQIYGDPIPEIEWRWLVPGFDMPWQFASGYNLKEEPLMWEFDKDSVSVMAEKWDHLEEDQLGIEIRFQWQGKWRRELHRFPLTRHRLVDGRDFWKIGRELLPPVKYEEEP